jgi:hypothetical protein
MLLALLLVAGCAASIGSEGDGPDAGPLGGDDGKDDSAAMCSADPCDLFDQCGCEPGDACDLDPSAFATGGALCRDANPRGDGSATCQRDTDCAVGFSCLGNPGQCRRLCENAGDCGGNRCAIQIVYNTGDGYADVPGARACTKRCKLEAGAGSGCPDTPWICCRLYGDDDGFYTDCTAAARTGGGDAASCETGGTSACAPGFDCVLMRYTDDTQRRECRQMCIVSISGQPSASSCGVGTCRARSTPVRIGDIEYGLCY